MRYFINYGTGAGNEYVDGSLEEAKRIAEKGLCYTQQDVKIQTDDGETISVLKWCAVPPEKDDFITARFGDFGFYGEWWDL